MSEFYAAALLEIGVAVGTDIAGNCEAQARPLDLLFDIRPVDVDQMRIVLVRAGHEVHHPAQFLVAVHGNLQSHGAAEAQGAAGRLLDLLGCGHLEFRGAQQRAKACFVQFPVAPDQRRDRSRKRDPVPGLAVRHVDEGLHQSLGEGVQEVAYLLNRVRLRCIHLRHLLRRLGWFCDDDPEIGDLLVCRIPARRANENGILTRVGQQHELLCFLAADRAGAGVHSDG